MLISRLKVVLLNGKKIPRLHSSDTHIGSKISRHCGRRVWYTLCTDYRADQVYIQGSKIKLVKDIFNIAFSLSFLQAHKSSTRSYEEEEEEEEEEARRVWRGNTVNRIRTQQKGVSRYNHIYNDTFDFQFLEPAGLVFLLEKVANIVRKLHRTSGPARP